MFLPPYFHLYWHDTPGGIIGWQGKMIELDSSFALLIPPFTVFSESTRRPFNHNYIFFTAEAPFDLVSPQPKIIKLDKAGQENFRKLKRLFTASDSLPRQFLLVKYLVCHVLLKLGESDFLFQSAVSAEVASVMKTISANVYRSPSNTTLTKSVNMSVSTLTRRFRQEVGQSLHSYMLFMRVRTAMPLLESGGQSIDQIAAALGFADRYHFTRVFKKYTGGTPAKFRSSFSTFK